MWILDLINVDLDVRSSNLGNRMITTPILTNYTNVLSENKVIIEIVCFTCKIMVGIDYHMMDEANLKG